MKFEELLAAVGNEPLFETGLLLAGDVDPAAVHRQLSRWAKAGRLYQLRRGLYAVAPPFQRVRPHPYVVANRLVPGSYVSLQSALGHFALIPESVPVTTSVTTGRPGQWDTPLGTYLFRHIQPDFLTGFRRTLLMGDQEALLATPEKALWTSSTSSRTATRRPTSPSSASRTWTASTWRSFDVSPKPPVSPSSVAPPRRSRVWRRSRRRSTSRYEGDLRLQI